MKGKALIPLGIGACLVFGIAGHIADGTEASAVAALINSVGTHDVKYEITESSEKEAAADITELSKNEVKEASAFKNAQTYEAAIAVESYEEPAAKADTEAAVKADTEAVVDVDTEAVVKADAEAAAKADADSAVYVEVQSVENERTEPVTNAASQPVNAEASVQNAQEAKQADTFAEVENVTKKEETVGKDIPEANEASQEEHECEWFPVYETLHHEAETHIGKEYVQKGHTISGSRDYEYGDVVLSVSHYSKTVYTEDGGEELVESEENHYHNGKEISKEDWGILLEEIRAQAEADGESLDGCASSALCPDMEEKEVEIVDKEAYDEEVINHYECSVCGEETDEITND